MLGGNPEIIDEVRALFAQVDHCPEHGSRIFFENAGGALTLKSVVARSAEHAAIPDNQGRDNPGSHALTRMIAAAKDDIRLLFNAKGGQVLAGESGTELLFRLISNAALSHRAAGGAVLGSTFEHPASASARTRWAEIAGLRAIDVPHDDATGRVTPEAYAAAITPDTRVATVLHTSPVTGMGVDLPGIAAAIRATAPDCLIIVDGIQHAAHGHIDIEAAGVDGYVISPYKMFSRHGYGLAWISDRLAAVPHDTLIGGPGENWELGTRDAGAYATFREVVSYLEWLGGRVGDLPETARRERIEAAGAAIRAHEGDLVHAMLHGTGNQAGLADLPGVDILGGLDNPAREGLVSFTLEGREAPWVVAELNTRGIRTHARKADHYSGNILRPLGLEDCTRVSMCHYNTEAEVAAFLDAMREIAGAPSGKA
ncbi:aminotransferase class V-fold PLP-dependent enzyme [Profundibacterium mesophilum]|uniref:Cysteine desulfurase selenocysteine lyase n=1 Tax=Profundibacterium mesophilum KAUST100406-0324 TaxID=1037889 RepID=A0A921NR92_9RHOB|nr:aminotransferase class V-fold PLP-dependent enzyme [Profundibacterium mesophilum]KAF0676022.1 cysteine desulfurase selenocysteine lyase [Profundibacterium mesophilum KAUST100406-0324]